MAGALKELSVELRELQSLLPQLRAAATDNTPPTRRRVALSSSGSTFHAAVIHDELDSLPDDDAVSDAATTLLDDICAQVQERCMALRAKIVSSIEADTTNSGNIGGLLELLDNLTAFAERADAESSASQKLKSDGLLRTNSRRSMPGAGGSVNATPTYGSYAGPPPERLSPGGEDVVTGLPSAAASSAVHRTRSISSVSGMSELAPYPRGIARTLSSRSLSRFNYAALTRTGTGGSGTSASAVGTSAVAVSDHQLQSMMLSASASSPLSPGIAWPPAGSIPSLARTESGGSEGGPSALSPGLAPIEGARASIPSWGAASAGGLGRGARALTFQGAHSVASWSRALSAEGGAINGLAPPSAVLSALAAGAAGGGGRFRRASTSYSAANAFLNTSITSGPGGGLGSSGADDAGSTGGHSGAGGHWPYSAAIHGNHGLPMGLDGGLQGSQEHSFSRLLQFESVAHLLRLAVHGPNPPSTTSTPRGGSSPSMSEGGHTGVDDDDDNHDANGSDAAARVSLPVLQARCNAAMALSHLALDPNTHAEIIQCGGLAVLLDLFREATSETTRLHALKHEQHQNGSTGGGNNNNTNLALEQTAWSQTRENAARAVTRILQFARDRSEVLDDEKSQISAATARALYGPSTWQRNQEKQRNSHHAKRNSRTRVDSSMGGLSDDGGETGAGGGGGGGGAAGRSPTHSHVNRSPVQRKGDVDPQPQQQHSGKPGESKQRSAAAADLRTAAQCIALTLTIAVPTPMDGGSAVAPAGNPTEPVASQNSHSSKDAHPQRQASVGSGTGSQTGRRKAGSDAAAEAVGSDGHSALSVATALCNLCFDIRFRSDMLCADLPATLVRHAKRGVLETGQKRKGSGSASTTGGRGKSLPAPLKPGTIIARDPNEFNNAVGEWSALISTSNPTVAGAWLAPMLLHLADARNDFPALPPDATEGMRREWLLHAWSFSEAKRLSLLALDALCIASQRVRSTAADTMHLVSGTSPPAPGGQPAPKFVPVVSAALLTPDEVRLARLLCGELSPPVDLLTKLACAGAPSKLVPWIAASSSTSNQASASSNSQTGTQRSEMQRCALSILRMLASPPLPKTSILNIVPDAPVIAGGAAGGAVGASGIPVPLRVRTSRATSLGESNRSDSEQSGADVGKLGKHLHKQISGHYSHGPTNSRVLELRSMADADDAVGAAAQIAARRRAGSDPPPAAKRQSSTGSVTPDASDSGANAGPVAARSARGTGVDARSSTLDDLSRLAALTAGGSGQPLGHADGGAGAAAHHASGQIGGHHSHPKYSALPEIGLLSLSQHSRHPHHGGDVHEAWECCASELVKAGIIQALAQRVTPNYAAASNGVQSSGSGSDGAANATGSAAPSVHSMPLACPIAADCDQTTLSTAFELIRSLSSSSSIETRALILLNGGVAVLSSAAQTSLQAIALVAPKPEPKPSSKTPADGEHSSKVSTLQQQNQHGDGGSASASAASHSHSPSVPGGARSSGRRTKRAGTETGLGTPPLRSANGPAQMPASRNVHGSRRRAESEMPGRNAGGSQAHHSPHHPHTPHSGRAASSHKSPHATPAKVTATRSGGYPHGNESSTDATSSAAPFSSTFRHHPPHLSPMKRPSSARFTPRATMLMVAGDSTDTTAAENAGGKLQPLALRSKTLNTAAAPIAHSPNLGRSATGPIIPGGRRNSNDDLRRLATLNTAAQAHAGASGKVGSLSPPGSTAAAPAPDGTASNSAAPAPEQSAVDAVSPASALVTAEGTIVPGTASKALPSSTAIVVPPPAPDRMLAFRQRAYTSLSARNVTQNGRPASVSIGAGLSMAIERHRSRMLTAGSAADVASGVDDGNLLAGFDSSISRSASGYGSAWGYGSSSYGGPLLHRQNAFDHGGSGGVGGGVGFGMFSGGGARQSSILYPSESEADLMGYGSSTTAAGTPFEQPSLSGAGGVGVTMASPSSITTAAPAIAQLQQSAVGRSNTIRSRTASIASQAWGGSVLGASITGPASIMGLSTVQDSHSVIGSSVREEISLPATPVPGASSASVAGGFPVSGDPNQRPHPMSAPPQPPSPKRALDAIVVAAVESLSHLASTGLDESGTRIFVSQGGLRVLLAGLKHQAEEMSIRLRARAKKKQRKGGQYAPSSADRTPFVQGPGAAASTAIQGYSNAPALQHGMSKAQATNQSDMLQPSVYVPALSAVAQMVGAGTGAGAGVQAAALARSVLSHTGALTAMVTMLQYIGPGIEGRVTMQPHRDAGQHSSTTTAHHHGDHHVVDDDDGDEILVGEADDATPMETADTPHPASSPLSSHIDIDESDAGPHVVETRLHLVRLFAGISSALASASGETDADAASAPGTPPASTSTSTSVVSKPPAWAAAAGILCSYRCTATLLLLTASDNQETGRQAVKAVASLCGIPCQLCAAAGCATPTATKPATTPERPCLRCGSGCDRLTPAIAVAHSLSCLRLYGDEHQHHQVSQFAPVSIGGAANSAPGNNSPGGSSAATPHSASDATPSLHVSAGKRGSMVSQGSMVVKAGMHGGTSGGATNAGGLPKPAQVLRSVSAPIPAVAAAAVTNPHLARGESDGGFSVNSNAANTNGLSASVGVMSPIGISASHHLNGGSVAGRPQIAVPVLARAESLRSPVLLAATGLGTAVPAPPYAALLSHHCPALLLSPDLIYLLPPARYGPLVLLLSLLPSPNPLVVEAAVEGIAAMISAPGSASTLVPVIGYHALPLLLSIAVDHHTSMTMLASLQHILVACGFQGGVRDITNVCCGSVPIALWLWRQNWERASRRRWLWHRYVSRVRAWETPQAHKQWRKVRGRLTRMEVPTAVLGELVRQHGAKDQVPGVSELLLTRQAHVTRMCDKRLPRLERRLAALGHALARCAEIEMSLLGLQAQAMHAHSVIGADAESSMGLLEPATHAFLAYITATRRLAAPPPLPPAPSGSEPGLGTGGGGGSYRSPVPEETPFGFQSHGGGGGGGHGHGSGWHGGDDTDDKSSVYSGRSSIALSVSLQPGAVYPSQRSATPSYSQSTYHGHGHSGSIQTPPHSSSSMHKAPKHMSSGQAPPKGASMAMPPSPSLGATTTTAAATFVRMLFGGSNANQQQQGGNSSSGGQQSTSASKTQVTMQPYQEPRFNAATGYRSGGSFDLDGGSITGPSSLWEKLNQNSIGSSVGRAASGAKKPRPALASLFSRNTTASPRESLRETVPSSKNLDSRTSVGGLNSRNGTAAIGSHGRSVEDHIASELLSRANPWFASGAQAVTDVAALGICKPEQPETAAPYSLPAEHAWLWSLLCHVSERLLRADGTIDTAGALRNAETSAWQADDGDLQHDDQARPAPRNHRGARDVRRKGDGKGRGRRRAVLTDESESSSAESGYNSSHGSEVPDADHPGRHASHHPSHQHLDQLDTDDAASSDGHVDYQDHSHHSGTGDIDGGDSSSHHKQQSHPHGASGGGGGGSGSDWDSAVEVHGEWDDIGLGIVPDARLPSKTSGHHPHRRDRAGEGEALNGRKRKKQQPGYNLTAPERLPHTRAALCTMTRVELIEGASNTTRVVHVQMCSATEVPRTSMSQVLASASRMEDHHSMKHHHDGSQPHHHHHKAHPGSHQDDLAELVGYETDSSTASDSASGSSSSRSSDDFEEEAAVPRRNHGHHHGHGHSRGHHSGQRPEGSENGGRGRAHGKHSSASDDERTFEGAVPLAWEQLSEYGVSNAVAWHSLQRFMATCTLPASINRMDAAKIVSLPVRGQPSGPGSSAAAASVLEQCLEPLDALCEPFFSFNNEVRLNPTLGECHVPSITMADSLAQAVTLTGVPVNTSAISTTASAPASSASSIVPVAAQPSAKALKLLGIVADPPANAPTLAPPVPLLRSISSKTPKVITLQWIVSNLVEHLSRSGTSITQLCLPSDVLPVAVQLMKHAPFTGLKKLVISAPKVTLSSSSAKGAHHQAVVSLASALSDLPTSLTSIALTDDCIADLPLDIVLDSLPTLDQSSSSNGKHDSSAQQQHSTFAPADTVVKAHPHSSSSSSRGRVHVVDAPPAPSTPSVQIGITELAILSSPRTINGSHAVRRALKSYITKHGVHAPEDASGIDYEPPSFSNDCGGSGCELGASMFGLPAFRYRGPWLQHLDFTQCSLGDDGAADVIWALSTPYSTVVSCNLSFNNVLGGINLVEALTKTGEGLFYTNTSLRMLNLAGNQLAEGVAGRIVQVLGHAKLHAPSRDLFDRFAVIHTAQIKAAAHRVDAESPSPTRLHSSSGWPPGESPPSSTHEVHADQEAAGSGSHVSKHAHQSSPSSVTAADASSSSPTRDQQAAGSAANRTHEAQNQLSAGKAAATANASSSSSGGGGIGSVFKSFFSITGTRKPAQATATATSTDHTAASPPHPPPSTSARAQDGGIMSSSLAAFTSGHADTVTAASSPASVSAHRDNVSRSPTGDPVSSAPATVVSTPLQRQTSGASSSAGANLAHHHPHALSTPLPQAPRSVHSQSSTLSHSHRHKVHVVTRVSSLSLASCGLHSKSFTDALIFCLENNKSLRELDLSSNHLTSESGSRLVVSATYHMKHFWFLRLANNPAIRSDDRVKIATVLRKRRALWAAHHAPPTIDDGPSTVRASFAAAAELEPDGSNVKAKDSHGTDTAVVAKALDAAVAAALEPASVVAADSLLNAKLAAALPSDATNFGSATVSPPELPPAVALAASTPAPATSASLTPPSTPSITGPSLRVTALFAAPLVVYMSDGQMLPLTALDVESERRTIWEGLNGNGSSRSRVGSSSSSSGGSLVPTTPSARRSHHAQIQFGCLTMDSLRTAITRGCDILHISCHGGVDWIAVETSAGDTHILGEAELRDLLNAGSSTAVVGGATAAESDDAMAAEGTATFPAAASARPGLIDADGSPRIKLVVIAACQSHWAAPVFSSAGVPHVLCVEPQGDVLDSSCLAYLSGLYTALGSNPTGVTLQSAHGIGLQAMRARNGVYEPPAKQADENESDSERGASVAPIEPTFILHCASVGPDASNQAAQPLLSSSAIVPTSSPGAAAVVSADDDGPSWSLLLSSLPALPEHFTGRERALHNVIVDLVGARRARVITVAGQPGLGKSALSIALAHWAAIRRVFAGGVVYVDCHGITGLQGLVSAVQRALNIGEAHKRLESNDANSSGALRISKPGGHGDAHAHDVGVDSSIRVALADIASRLHDCRVLLVLDGIDGQQPLLPHSMYGGVMAPEHVDYTGYQQPQNDGSIMQYWSGQQQQMMTQDGAFSQQMLLDEGGPDGMLYQQQMQEGGSFGYQYSQPGGIAGGAAMLYQQYGGGYSPYAYGYDYQYGQYNQGYGNYNNGGYSGYGYSGSADAMSLSSGMRGSLPMPIPLPLPLADDAPITSSSSSSSLDREAGTEGSAQRRGASSSVPALPLTPDILRSAIGAIVFGTLFAQILITKRTPLGGLRVCGEVVHHLQPLAPDDAARLIAMLTATAAFNSGNSISNSNSSNDMVNSLDDGSALMMLNGDRSEMTPSSDIGRRATAISRATGGVPARLLEAVQLLASPPPLQPRA